MPSCRARKARRPQIGRNDRNQHREQNHPVVVLDREMPGKAVDSNIVHAGDADAEQHGRRHHANQRRLADADKEQGDADHKRADQKRDDGGKHQIDRIGRQRRGQHADEMHGPDADSKKRRRTRQQRARADAPRIADARRKAKAGISSQDRDRYRERDEIGIVSFEHDLAGLPVSTGQASSRRRVYRHGGGNDNRSIVLVYAALWFMRSAQFPPRPGRAAVPG